MAKKRKTVEDRAWKVAIRIVPYSLVESILKFGCPIATDDIRSLVRDAYRQGWMAANADSRRKGSGE